MSSLQEVARSSQGICFCLDGKDLPSRFCVKNVHIVGLCLGCGYLFRFYSICILNSFRCHLRRLLSKTLLGRYVVASSGSSYLMREEVRNPQAIVPFLQVL